MKLDFDLHVHTFHSPCGKAEMLPSDIIRVAAERGLSRLAITDHWYPTTDTGIIADVRMAVSEAQERLGTSIQVFYGCEAEVMSPGSTAGSAELADMLDFVMVGATHFVNKPMTILPEGDDEFRARYFLEMFDHGVSHSWVNVMAHPFFVFPSICSASILEHLKDSDLLPAIERAKENNVAMEISRRVLVSPEQEQFSMRFLRLCKRVGLKFTCGSDAHQLKDLGQMHLLEPIINDLELTDADIWIPTSKG